MKFDKPFFNKLLIGLIAVTVLGTITGSVLLLKVALCIVLGVLACFIFDVLANHSAPEIKTATVQLRNDYRRDPTD